MRTVQEVRVMYDEVTARVNETHKRLEEFERKYSMGLITEQTLSHVNEHLASQTGQQHALAWVIWHDNA